MKIIIWLAAAMIAAASARAGTGREDVPLEKHLSLGAHPSFECVGKVLRDGGFSGSAILIDSLHVLSAAHMFLDSDREQVKFAQGEDTIIVYQPKNTRVTTSKNLQVVFGNDTVMVDTFEMHPLYMSSERRRADLVMLKLRNPIRGISPVRFNSGAVRHGTEVMMVGYGPLSNAGYNERVLRGRCAGWNVIDSITDQVLVCDMDHPTKPEMSTLGDSTALEYEYVSTGGDSGGGMFVVDGDGYSLAGLVVGTSFDTRLVVKQGVYGSQCFFTRTDVYYSWIAKAAK